MTAGTMKSDDVLLRSTLKATDREAIRSMVVATKMFCPDEVAVADELVAAHLAQGDASGYWFVVAEDRVRNRVCGYAAFGPIPCTQTAFDLYWIAVDPATQGLGIGKRLIESAEDRVRAAGGTCVYIDTSGRDYYKSTHLFYEACGYCRAAELPDFYAPGDSKVIYVKRVTGQ